MIESNRVSTADILIRLFLLVPRVLIPLFLIVTTFYFARTMGLVTYETWFALPDEVKVPDLVGTDVQEAQDMLKRLGLELDVQEARFKDNVKKNRIMEQDPPAGRTVRKGRKVAVVWSMGPEMVTVPKVVEMGLREARITISNARLNLGKVTTSPRKAGEPEVVLSQNPSADKQVKRGTKFNLVVNEGAVARVKVPMYQGDPIDKVRGSIAAADLHLGNIEWMVHQSIGAGIVVRQTPAANQEVAPGTVVSLKVSLGSELNVHSIRQKTVTIHTPDMAGPQEIRVLMTDATGTYEVYSGIHYAGENVVLTLTALSPEAEYQVFSGEKMLERSKIRVEL